MEKVLEAKIYRAVQPSPGRKEEMLHCFQHFKREWMETKYYIWHRGAYRLARG